jgi:uncharacterized membrane protein YcaP (DUF421 family)
MEPEASPLKPGSLSPPIETRNKETPMHAKLWTDLFIPGLPLIDKILRAVIVYSFLVVALKLAGRRELAQLNAFDLVVLLTISNTVQNAIIGNDNSVTGGLVGATTLLMVNYLVVRVVFEYGWKRRHIGDPGVVLVANGRVRQESLKKELISLDELKEAANRQGYSSLGEVEHGVLNPDGSFAFVKKKDRAENPAYQEILNRIDHLAEQIGRLQPGEGPVGR